MTTSTGISTQTSSQLLYLSVDLGDQPDLDDYGRHVAALQLLAETAAGFALGQPLASRDVRLEHRYFFVQDIVRGIGEGTASTLTPVPLRVVRTSLASPWVSVLADLARTSTPVGYGAATLYGLHQLLRMIITWQRHRLEIAEREQQVERLRQDVRRETVRLAQELLRGKEVGPITSAGLPGSESEEIINRVTDAGADFGEIMAAEMIAPDDPRAAGEPATGSDL